MIDDIPQPELVEFHVDSDGVDFTSRHPIAPEVAALLVEAFRTSLAANYVSWEVATADQGPMILTMRRKWGYPPELLAARYRESLEAIAAGALDPVDIARRTVKKFGKAPT